MYSEALEKPLAQKAGIRQGGSSGRGTKSIQVKVLSSLPITSPFRPRNPAPPPGRTASALPELCSLLSECDGSRQGQSPAPGRCTLNVCRVNK